MKSRDLKLYTNRYGKFFEPLMVLTLLAVFTLPVISVLNISPRTKADPTPKQTDVLGIKAGFTGFEISKIGGQHNIIVSESLLSTSNTRFVYKANIQKRDRGNYSKPILKISNSGNEPLQLTFLLKPTTSNSEIGILYGDTNYVLKDKDGNIYHHTSTPPVGEQFIYLSVKAGSDVNFSEQVEISIAVNKE